MFPLSPLLLRYLPAAAGVVTVILALVGIYYAGRSSANADWEARWARAEAESMAALADAERRARESEAAMQTAVDEARARAEEAADEVVAQKGEIDALNRNIARLRVDRDGLHGDLVNFAEAAGSAKDSLSACVGRARGLAELLAGGAELVVGCGELVRAGAELAGESAAAAELRGSKLRACVEAWPR